MSWDVRIGDGVDPAAYRALLDRAPSASYLQDHDWPEFAPRKKGHDYIPVTVGRAGAPVALAGLLRRSRVGPGLGLGAFRRGPVTMAPEDLAVTLPPLVARLRRMGILTLGLNPRWEDDRIAPARAALASAGARELPPARQTLHVATGLIDLDADAETLRGRLDAKVRKSLRQAEKAGVTMGPITGPDSIRAFETWLGALSERNAYDISGLPRPAAQIEHAARFGGLAREVRMQGELIGVFTGMRDHSRLLFSAVGWNEASARLPRLYLMVDEFIRTGLATAGIETVDLGGLQPVERRGTDAAADNRERGKLSCNPRIVDLLPAHEIAIVPGAARAMDLARRALG